MNKRETEQVHLPEVAMLISGPAMTCGQLFVSVKAL